MNYEIVISYEILTNAKDDNEFINIFNDKLASLILYYEKGLNIINDNLYYYCNLRKV